MHAKTNCVFEMEYMRISHLTVHGDVEIGERIHLTSSAAWSVHGDIDFLFSRH